MPKISALLHTHNDALRLGRALDSLRPCDEVLIIDQDSEDETEKVAREHGATFKTAIAGVTSGAYAMDASMNGSSTCDAMKRFRTSLRLRSSSGKRQSPKRPWPAIVCPSARRMVQDGRSNRRKCASSIANG